MPLLQSLTVVLVLVALSSATLAQKRPLYQEDASIYNALQASPNACNQATLTAAIAAAQAAGAKILLLSAKDTLDALCTWTITTNTTIPLVLWVPGNNVSINSGVTLTVNGQVVNEESQWWAGNGSVAYGVPQQQEPWSHMVAGCLPSAPAASLTLPAFACSGFVRDGPASWAVAQTAASVTVPDSPTVWLALHRSTTSLVSGWTRQGTTHYLWKAQPTQPVDPPGGALFARVAVAGSVISSVADLRWLSAAEARAGVVNVRSYGAIPDDAGDDTAAFQAAIVSARSKRTAVFIPTGVYDLSSTLVLGGVGVPPVNLLGTANEWGHAPQLGSILRANMDAPLLQLKGTGDGAGLAAGALVRNLELINEHTGPSNYVLNLAYVGGMRVHDVDIRTGGVGVGHVPGESLIISSEFRNVLVTGSVQTTTNVGYQGDFWNVTWFGGRVIGLGSALHLTGSSQAVYGLDAEFNQVFLRHHALGSFACYGCHIESTNVILTNADTVPITLSGPWSDAGGNGSGISGTVLFDNCFFGLPASESNEFVLKNQPSFVYHVIVRGGTFVGVAPIRMSGTFQKDTPSDIPAGTLVHLEGAPATNIAVSRVTDSFSNRLLIDLASLRTDRLAVASELRMVEDATQNYGLYSIPNGLQVKGFAAVRLQTVSPSMSIDFAANSLTPGVTNAVDLGNASFQWKDLYMTGAYKGKHQIYAAGTVPAPSASMDGRIVLEETSAGTHDLVYYVGGERYRVNGTLAP